MKERIYLKSHEHLEIMDVNADYSAGMLSILSTTTELYLTYYFETYWLAHQFINQILGQKTELVFEYSDTMNILENPVDIRIINAEVRPNYSNFSNTKNYKAILHASENYSVEKPKLLQESN